MPADFGLVSIATATIAILEVLGSFSFDIALIQRKDCDRTHYDTAWTFNVTVGLLASVLVLTLAQPAASFYNEPRLRDLLYLLSLSPLVGSLENIGIVAFRKEMQFHKEFAFLISKRLISTVLTLILAVTLRSYWALALGILIGRIVGTALSYILNSYRPKLSLSKRKELMSFSVWSFSNNMLYFVGTRAADFIIGKTGGPTVLGIFNISHEIANLPTTEVAAPINRAVFSGYSKMNTQELSEAYISVLSMSALFTIPAALGICALASIIVPTLLGEKWNEAIPAVQILAICGLIQAIQGNISYVYYSLGIPKTVTKFSIIYIFLMIPGFTIGSLHRGAIGASAAIVVASLITTPINIHHLVKMLDIKYKSILNGIWRPCAAGAGMLVFLSYTKESLPKNFYSLIYLVISGALTYTTIVYLLWEMNKKPYSPERKIVQFFKNKLNKIYNEQQIQKN